MTAQFAHAAMREAVVRAEAESRAKTAFLASMSHELRTPLNGVLGMASLLLDSELGEEQRSLVEVIQDSGQSLLGLINDILDISKIEAGRMELEDAAYDPVDLVEGVVQLLAPIAQKKGVALGAVIGTGLPLAVQGDGHRVRQILLNLVGNAVKFTSEGQVRVSLEASAGPTPERICFSVRDTGIGIPRDVLPRLFEEFVQADTTTTRRFGGTGLGLAICHHLATLMGGRIQVESREGVGSCFTLEIPLVADATRGLRDEPPPQRGLLADPLVECRELLAAQLERWQFEIETAADTAGLQQTIERASRDGRTWDFTLVDEELLVGESAHLVVALRRLSKRLVLVGRGVNSSGPVVEADGRVSRPPRDSALRALLGSGPGLVAHRRATPQLGVVARSVRVLVVDDQKVNRRVARMMLERGGYRVDEAESGLEALTAVVEGSFAVVLMDVQMPELDGLEVTRRLRGHPMARVARIPIIGLTANAMPTDECACLDAGMSDFLTKPVDRTSLLATVKRWTSQD